MKGWEGARVEGAARPVRRAAVRVEARAAVRRVVVRILADIDGNRKGRGAWKIGIGGSLYGWVFDEGAVVWMIIVQMRSILL